VRHVYSHVSFTCVCIFWQADREYWFFFLFMFYFLNLLFVVHLILGFYQMLLVTDTTTPVLPYVHWLGWVRSVLQSIYFDDIELG
jgi:hypothetical protein